MRLFLKFGLVLMLWQAAALQAATTVTNIAAGSLHSLFIESDGSLWAMGYNGMGELGDGTYSANNPYRAVIKPERIVASGVTATAAGFYHSLFIKSDGSLWVMGSNVSGQLGNGRSNLYTNKPEQIVSSGVIAVAAGNNHSLFVKSDGTLWAMGDNYKGQLGDGTYNNTNKPELIVAGGVTAVAAKGDHSFFLKSDGSLWAIGDNQYGQLGDGTYNNINKPELIVASGVTAITGGDGNSLFLKSDGSLWAMGWNGGQFGNGTNSINYPYGVNRPEQIVASGVIAIAAGDGHSLFLRSDGSLWAMGSNYEGQFGNGTYDSTNRPEQIVPSGVTAIAAGDAHSLLLKSDGSLWGTGYNFDGELGDGFTDSVSPYGTAMLEQIVPLPQLVLTQELLFQTNVQLTAICGYGGKFYLLSTTNLAQPLSQWTRVWLKAIIYRNDYLITSTLTNAVNSNPGHQFYILQSQ